MAEFRDGSLRAEMAQPDMRLPIQLAMAWPERLSTGVEPVPLTEKALTFEPVDREAFPAVDLAYRVGGLGLTFPAVMNAANEVAVMAFLEGKIPLNRIVELVQTVVDEHEPASVVSVVNIERADTWARQRDGGDHRGSLAKDFPVTWLLGVLIFFPLPHGHHRDPRGRALLRRAPLRHEGHRVLRGVRPVEAVVPRARASSSTASRRSGPAAT